MGKQPQAAFSYADRRVYDPVAAERGAQLGSGQRIGARQIASQLGQFSPSARRAIPRAEQQGSPPVAHRVADPVEPGNGQTGPSGQPERIDNPTGQQSFE